MASTGDLLAGQPGSYPFSEQPAMVACWLAGWLAATKVGAVVRNTMPMLRAAELAKIVDKAEITSISNGGHS